MSMYFSDFEHTFVPEKRRVLLLGTGIKPITLTYTRPPDLHSYLPDTYTRPLDLHRFLPDNYTRPTDLHSYLPDTHTRPLDLHRFLPDNHTRPPAI